MVSERQDVLTPRAQWGHVNHVESQPVQQIRSEPPGCRQTRQIFIGRSNDPHVGVQRIRAADPLKLPVLDHSEDLLLHAQRHRAQLVQNQSAAVGLLKSANVGAHCAGEGSCLVAEQFRLQETLGQSRTVHFDQRCFPAR